MEQHPVPQNISSYEFRLVGDMTLKQFGYLAGGVILALVIYNLPLPGFLKWPLVILPAFGGFALAFMPIEERPLSTWIIAFLRAVFSPTIFVWKKATIKPEVFEPVTSTPTPSLQPVSIPPVPEVVLPIFPPVMSEPEKPKVVKPPPVEIKPPPMEIKPLPVEDKPLVEMRTEIKPPELKIAVKPVVLPEKPGRVVQSAVKAKQSLELSIPVMPSRPNMLVGMVLNASQEIVDGAIIEIRNSQGMPVRALKTNKLGQFMIATPLENDIYEIETEKEGLAFDIIKLEVKGEIVKPLEIRAKPAL